MSVYTEQSKTVIWDGGKKQINITVDNKQVKENISKSKGTYLLRGYFCLNLKVKKLL